MIAGLGNPGKKYVGTRHNLGFMVIDSLSKALGIEVKKKKFGGLLGEAAVEDEKLILLKPCQFMNLSGQVIATATGFYRLAIDNLLVITDDTALPVGVIRIRAKGSAGGRNGLADIIDKFGENVNRLRIGIGGGERMSSVDYVLSRPPEDEMVLLNKAVEKAKDAVICWAGNGVDEAMAKFNCIDSQENENKQ